MKGVIRGDKYLIDGREVTEREFFEAFPPAKDTEGTPGASLCGQKRIAYSDGAGIPPESVPEFMEYDKKHGVPVEYDKSGRPGFTSRQQKVDYLKAHGMHNRDETKG